MSEAQVNPVDQQQGEAQGCEHMDVPAEQHERLMAFAGEWNAQIKMWMGPGTDPMESTGTMVCTPVLGGRFLEQKYGSEGEMPFEGRGFWGFNSTSEEYEGFWIDSWSTFMQRENGHHDENTNSWEMVGSFVEPGGKKKMKKRTVIEVISESEHTLKMFFSTEDGSDEWLCMEIHYNRA